jgi:hypothetical protein
VTGQAPVANRHAKVMTAMLRKIPLTPVGARLILALR